MTPATTRALIAGLILILFATACGREESITTEASMSTLRSVDYTRILPAKKLPWEGRQGGKADAASDYHAAHPEWFEITTAPDKPNFRSMTEWEAMAGTLITFNQGLAGSSPDDLDISQTMTDIVKEAYLVGKVWVLYDTGAAMSAFTDKLTGAGVPASVIGAGQQIEFIPTELDAFWTIDFAPLPLIDNDSGSMAFLDWQYYYDRYHDDAMPSQLGEYWGVTTYRMPIDMEGGNFQADGLGNCYTTERGVQYAGVSAQNLATLLGEYAACENLVVLKDIDTDGTGHIDMLFKLAAPDKAILGSFTAAQDPVAMADMNENETILEGLELGTGTPMVVHRLPHPNSKTITEWGQTYELPRTYLNSLLVNGKNLWPMYSDDKDIEADALAAWQAAMPEWEHIGILSDTIALYSGAVHCVTRNIPDQNIIKWVEDGTCTDGACVSDGYTGACQGDGDCYGPQWQCVIDGDCGAGPASCDGVTYEGCCDGGSLKYCDEGTLYTQDCAAEAANGICGWAEPSGYAAGYYCGQPGQVDPNGDPSGEFPMLCPGGCEPQCDGATCGNDDGCGGSCGCGPGTTCEGGSCVSCTPQCDGKECGDDGCGGSCGACDGGACDPDTFTCVDPCMGVTFEGCCEGDTVKWCEDGELVEADCNHPDAGGPQCGWVAEASYYWCGTDGSADPSGVYPIDCGECEPSCAGKTCGDDGCGGSCGACDAGTTCDAGQCKPCAPSCDGRECGTDGCGGSCGDCGAGFCNDMTGQCSEDPCFGISVEGCCAGDFLMWCENDELITVECADTDLGPQCGWLANEAYYWCGTDGGTEPTGAYPLDCPADVYCKPECDGKVCGYDHCGGQCGLCQMDEECQDGACVPFSGCDDECSAGDMGCGVDGVPWSCTQTAQGCWVKTPGACEPGTTCQAGECLAPCDDMCQASEVGCSADGAAAWACATGVSGCLEKVTTPCAAGQTCADGLCVGGTDPDVVSPDTAQPDGAGQPDTGGTNPAHRDGGGGGGGCAVVQGQRGAALSMALLLLGLLVATRLRRRLI